jgi:hypothetical protein
MTMGAHQRLACGMVGVEPAGRQDYALFRTDFPARADDADNPSLFSQKLINWPFR